jgi:riboflavin synthase
MHAYVLISHHSFILYQAHVDTTATIVSRTADGDSLRLVFQLAPPTPEIPSVIQYIVPKGYVALDGASLTITHVDDAQRSFGVMLIKHTQEKITLSGKQIGAKVNVEVDMVGKYVEKSVVAALGGESGGNRVMEQMVRKVVEDVLNEKAKIA